MGEGMIRTEGKIADPWQLTEQKYWICNVNNQSTPEEGQIQQRPKQNFFPQQVHCTDSPIYFILCVQFSQKSQVSPRTNCCHFISFQSRAVWHVQITFLMWHAAFYILHGYTVKSIAHLTLPRKPVTLYTENTFLSWQKIDIVSHTSSHYDCHGQYLSISTFLSRVI